jgi:predicted nucleotidyltransferase
MPEKMDFLKPTTLKVLEFFFTHPAVECHEREVLRGAGISKGSANKILRELAGLAILRRTEKGRMVFYRLIADDPFVRQMKVLWNVWALRPFIRGMEGTARKILLFGSSAEGADSPESDIDILILTNEKTTAREKVSAFNRKSGRQLAPIIVDAMEFAAMRKEDRPLFERIDRGIVLWETV